MAFRLPLVHSIEIGGYCPHWSNADAGPISERERPMVKRLVVTLAVIAVFVAALGFVKFRQIQAGMAVFAAFQPPPEAVTTVVAGQEEWPDGLNAIGTVAALRGVTVSADLPGIV